MSVMHRRATKRVSVLLAGVAASALALSLVGGASATADAGDAATESLPSSVPLSGVLRVVPIEPDPDDAAVALSDGTLVTLVTDDGARVELTGDAVAGAVSGDRFDGTVIVTPAVEDAVIEAAGPEPLPTDEVALGELVAEAGAELETALEVTDAELEPIVEAAVAAKAHTIDLLVARTSSGVFPTEAEMNAHIARLSEFWSSQSNGQISAVTRPLAIRYATLTPDDLCDPDAMWPYAAGPSGFNRTGVVASDPSSYYWATPRAAHLAVVVPGDACGSGNGLGTIGTIHAGGMVWSSVDPDPVSWDGVQFHEVGHNVGLGHSNLTVCDEPLVDAPETSSSCSQQTYWDFYDVMGGGFTVGAYSNASNIAALNVTHKAHLDALPRTGTTPALRRVQTSDGAIQRHTLSPAGGTTGTRGLEIIDPVNGDRLFVEYRSGTGRDAASFYTRIATSGYPQAATYAPGVRVLKLDCAPATCEAPGSRVLQRWAAPGQAVLSHRTGHSFTSYTRAQDYPGVRIDVASMDAASAVVDITFTGGFATFNSPTVTVAGTPRYLQTLTAAVSPAWTPTPATTTYQWLRGGTPIDGATAATYIAQLVDIDASIAVRVGVQAPGALAKTLTSPAVKVTPAVLTAPTPRITGTPKAGRTLTVSPGTWTPGVTFRYKWYASNKIVEGATKSTFVPTSAHIGKTIAVRVAGSLTGYTATSKLSAPTTAVAKYSILKKSTPTITGTRAVGKTLTANPGAWTPGTTFSYQWYRNGVAVSGAKSVTYTLTASDRGKRMTVRVAGKKPGYLSTSVLSAPTAIIR